MTSRMVPVIAVGGIRYETNSFAPPSRLDVTSLRVGSDVLHPLASTEMAGALDAARELGVKVRGTLDVFGGCGGPADHGQFLELLDAFADALAGEPELDGVYLALHGAMATTAVDAAEVLLIERVRAVVGPTVPIVASCDLHAAVDDAFVAELAGIVGFKTCPHVDYEATGRAALGILHRAIVGGTRPQIHRQTIPLITAAESHDTTTGPLARHMAEAVARIGGDILDVSIFAVQPWLDSARTSWAVTVTFDSSAGSQSAQDMASEIRDHLMADAPRFVPKKVAPSVAAGMIAHATTTPLLLADSGDSPSAGATGGSTDLLSHVVGAGDAKVLATVTDRDAAVRLHAAGAGSDATLLLGGVEELGIEPIELTLHLESVHDGRYLRSYPASECDIGACVVASHRNLTLVVTERPAFMVDTSLFDHVGIEPADFDAVVVKSAGGFRALWGPISNNFVTVDSRGASTSRLASLPYRLADRRFFVTAGDAQVPPLEATV